MGLLKWLKRERDFSPKNKRRLSEPPSMCNKTKLMRNESYLKALTKFNKWRQTYLLSNTNRDSLNFLSQRDDWAQEIQMDSGKFTAMDLIYEEIDDNIHSSSIYQRNRSFSDWKSPTTSDLFNRRKQMRIIRYKNSENDPNCENSNSKNSDSRTNSINSYDIKVKLNENFEHSEEPEYAVPCTTNTSSELKEVEIFETYVEKNFDFLNKTDDIGFEMNYNKLWNNKLIVTDLDKSQSSIDNLNINSKMENLVRNRSLTNIEFPEFMMYPLIDISEVNNDNSFDITSGNIKHGISKYINISYLVVEEHNFHAIHQNFESLRTLRHPNILLLMGVSLNVNSSLEALILEPLNCVLYDVIHFYRRLIEVTECYDYILQIINAVIYLNQHQLIHSNICSRNIILCQTSGVLKLAGFELITRNCRYIDQNKYTSTPVNDKNSDVTLACSIEYRKRYSMHFYQAPELLSETKEYIQPTYKSDVYGICITLWEMLNCVIPYAQFTYSELVKVFSLKKAQLPIYEEQRNLPFKSLYDGGLDIQTDNRFENVIFLKNALQNVQIKNFIAENNQIHCQESFKFFTTQDLNTSIKSKKFNEQLFDERTSTIKNRKKSTIQTKFNDSKSQNNEWKNIFDTFCTPPPTKNIIKMNKKSRKSMNLTEPLIVVNENNENNFKEIIVTPNKKYNVNILIKSKCTPNSISTSTSEFGSNEQNTVNELKRNLNNSLMDNKVKEKICKFESFISESPTSNKCLDNSKISRTFDLNSSKFKYRKKYNLQSDCKKNENTNLKSEELHFNSNQQQKQTLTIQDFYIDDDLPSDSNIGANLILNLNYVHDGYDDDDHDDDNLCNL